MPGGASVVRSTRQLIRDLDGQGKAVKVICVGRKGRDLLRRDHGGKIIATFDEIDRPRLSFEKADAIARKVGARGLKIILEELMLDVMYQVPSRSDVTEIVVTREVKSDPVPLRLVA